MPNFFVPLSGLNADSTALNTIANNLSNMNTTGFKAQTTNFSDLFYQQMGQNGSGDEIQVGTGVKVASNSTDFTTGSIAPTGISTDAAINGTGFFVLDNNGSQLYTRNGTFQTSASGVLESTDGLAVMGYAALNGVVTTGGALTDLSLPLGQTMQPSATTTFSMTQNLNSTSPIGTVVTGGPVQIYDSLGKSYEATVNYTNLGGNSWSYNIVLPDTLTAAPATAAAATTMAVPTPTPTATIVPAATNAVEPSTTVINPVTAGTATAAATTALLNPAATVTAASTTTLLTPETTPVPAAGTFIYNFPTSNGNVATLDPTTTTLKLSGLNGVPATVTTLAATFTRSVSGGPTETIADYVVDLQNAITAAGIVGVTVSSPAAGQLSIVGPATLSTVGNIGQDFTGNKVDFNFATSNGSLATIDPTTSLTITAPNVNGTNTTIGPLAGLTAGETVATYVAALQAKLTASNITGVTIGFTPANGKLTITGPTGMVVGGTVTQDFTGNQTNFTFGSYTDPTTGLTTQAAVDPTSALTITALNTSGVSTPVPIVLSNPAGESVAQYAIDINAALTTANISGVTATATNGVLSLVGPSSTTAITGYVNQDILGTTITSALNPTSPVSTTAAMSLAATTPVNATPATSTVAAVSDTTTVPGTTTDTYSFAATGTVAGATSITITGPASVGLGTASVTITPTTPDESVTAFYNDIVTKLALPATGIKTGAGGIVVANPASNKIQIGGPTASLVVSGAIKQDVALSTKNYNFISSNGALATVSPATNLAITEGATTVTAAAFTGNISLSSYATSLQSQLTANGITDVTVADNNGVLAITYPTDASFAGSVTQSFVGAQSSFDFGTYTDPNTGLTQSATVAGSTSLTIGSAPTINGTTVNVTVAPLNPAGESLAQYVTQVQNALAAKGVTGVQVTAANGVMTITAPDGVTIAGVMNQNMLGTTNNYTFASGSTVYPTTNLTITGETASGSTSTITAPAVSSGETLATYAAALTSAISTANIANVTVTANNGVLTIVGANVSTTGAVEQGLADTQINYNFGSSATVDPATAITIQGPTVTGTPATAITVAPTVIAGETVAQYAVALNNALAKAGIITGADGVTVTATGGMLSIVGPAATLKASGSATQDLTANTITYNFGSSGGTVSTVDQGTNLTITGLNTAGKTMTTTYVAPTAGQTLISYATQLTNELAASGITGVTVSATAAGQLNITGANITTSGQLIQDAVGSANTSGTLVFNSNGNLTTPAANLANVTFAGLSDNANNMNMTWNLYGTSGSGYLSQNATASGTSATLQNGYTAGVYNGFNVNPDGTISATYSNSQTQTVGQIALATVSNTQGLVDVGSTEYQTTVASGQASVGVANSGGRGSLEGKSLEASNVNISQEFSNLIVAQRAFEANSKSVTTFDTITQETINMIH